ncbi:MAG: SUMF1/EgtB/PvdO family nonheme iron enzyme, partial [Myxococcota bacterium]
GAPDDDPYGNQMERPLHEVSVAGFHLMRHEVTQALWKRIMGRVPGDSCTPKLYAALSLESPEFPVMCVSWLEAVAFANALSVEEGLAPVYTIKGADVQWIGGNGYRLPTEAEWEHAARGGRLDARWPGARDEVDLCRYANLADRSLKEGFHPDPPAQPGLCRDGHPLLAPVGTFQPNPFGLHDMAGNVAEWVWDWRARYPREPQRNPRVDTASWPVTGRAIRGGAFDQPARRMVVFDRDAQAPVSKSHRIGLRLARSRRSD